MKRCPAPKGLPQVGTRNPKATLLVSQPLFLSPLEVSIFGAPFYTLPPHFPLGSACPALSVTPASSTRLLTGQLLRCHPRDDRQGSPWARQPWHGRKPCGPEGTGSSKPGGSTPTSALPGAGVVWVRDACLSSGVIPCPTSI